MVRPTVCGVGVGFFNGSPNGFGRGFGFFFSMVRPTGLGGVSDFFSMVRPTVCGVGVCFFQWFAQRPLVLTCPTAHSTGSPNGLLVLVCPTSFAAGSPNWARFYVFLGMVGGFNARQVSRLRCQAGYLVGTPEIPVRDRMTV